MAILVVPGDIESYAYASQSYDEIFGALNWAMRYELDELRVEEADEDEPPAADPDAAVQPCVLDGLWYRSKSERKVAAALEAASVLFASNASLRIGITPDHSMPDDMVADFLRRFDSTADPP